MPGVSAATRSYTGATRSAASSGATSRACPHGPNSAEYVPLPFEPETHENSPQAQQVERLVFSER